jgi:hypothetical protein
MMAKPPSTTASSFDSALSEAPSSFTGSYLASPNACENDLVV